MSPANLMKFCSACGHPVEFRTPPGDHLPRHVCDHCGTIHYHNPRIIAGCVPQADDGRILMCKRAIEPRLGYWTFPAGFLELGETSAQGAARETLEEAQAEVEVDDLFAVISVPYVSQVYMLHRGRMKTPRHGPTPESSETVLLREDQIPWEEIAFPTIYHGLKFFFEDRARGVKGFHELDLTVRRPLKDHIQSGTPTT
ncbi:MAG: NUDIX hydrolase [Nevskia sp.]|nr:NUDIX hydrolase [Nevskia sp.]